MFAALLWLLPLALLFAALALGRYPGERALLRRRPMPRGRAPRALGNAGRPPHADPAAAAVLAFKRAVRPPPLRPA
jgi:hypothetical protein